MFFVFSGRVFNNKFGYTKSLILMKKKLHPFIPGLIVILCLLSPPGLHAVQLSGVYTIDSSQAATATNFKNFTSVITYLTSAGSRSDGGPANSSPFGVSGPVVFQVAAGTFNERIVITTTINGASPQNTIVFDGGAGNAATRIITFAGTAAASEQTLQLSNTRYLQFHNLTFRSMGSRGRGINITGSSGMITIKKCSVDISGGISSTSANYRGIMIESQSDSLEIDSNDINYGYYGIFVNGSSSAANNTFIRIRGNSVRNSYNNGIQATAVFNPLEISGNTVNMLVSANVSGQGIGMDNCPQNSGISHRIIGNKVVNGGKYAFRIINTNVSSANPTKVYNNMVAYTITNPLTGSIVDRYGFEIMTGVVEFYHNSANMYCIGSTSITRIYGLYFGGNDSSSFKNNILVCNGTLTASILQPYPAYFNINPSGNRVNYNIYYNALGTAANKTLVYRGSTNYNSTNYKAANAGGDSSFNLLPEWKSVDDLRFAGPCNLTKGVDLSSLVVADIDDEPRSATPHIGCDEFPMLANNLSIDRLLQPQVPVAAGFHDLRAVFRNVGSSPITDFAVSYELNNAFPVVQFWSSPAPLNTCDTVSVLFSGQINIMPGVNTLKVYSSNPNFMPDGNPANDSLNTTFITALAGNYTIGSTGADFSSFNQAVNALLSGGVTGPVTFDVMTGSYNEQISISPVTGASASNNITFRSMAGHRDSVTLSFNATSTANNYVIRLDKASYFTFSDMTVRALNTTNGRVIVLMDTATYDTVQNCNLATSSTSSTSDATSVVYGFVQGNNNIAILGNTISNGGYGIFMGQPNSSTSVRGRITIDGNTIQNFNNQNYFRAISKIRFRNNRVLTSSSNASFRGFYYIYGANTNDSFELTGNIFRQPGGDVLYIEDPNNIYGIIANNSIAITGPHNGTVNGIYADGVRNMRYYHNSVNIAAGSTSGGAAANLNSTTATNEVRNNIFSNENGGYALVLSNPLYFNSNHNSFYNSSGNLMQVSGTGTNYANLALWRSGVSKDQNSVQYRPGFTSSGNLEPNPADTASWSVNGRGVHLDPSITDVLNDLNGNPRPVNAAAGLTDIGAFQFRPTALAPQATAVPATVNPGDSQTFIFLGDTVARIYGSYYTGSGIQVRLYVGEAPVYASSPTPHMYWYTEIENPLNNVYDASIYYKDSWLGTIPQETDLRLVRRSAMTPFWGIDYTAQIDTVANIMHTYTLYETFYGFTGSDQWNPIPVKLLRLDAELRGEQVALSWSTASEYNSSWFEIERSFNGTDWSFAGKVKAAGYSQATTSYRFIDHLKDPAGYRQIFYRLRMTDLNGASEYSNPVSVYLHVRNNLVQVFPNPFSNELFVELNADLAETVDVKLYNITGQQLFSQQVLVSQGKNVVKLDQVSSLLPGAYFVSCSVNGKAYNIRLIK